MKKSILYILSTLFFTTQLYASNVDVNRYLAITVQPKTAKILVKLNIRGITHMDDLYTNDLKEHIKDKMSRREVVDLSGQKRHKFFHISVPGHIVRKSQHVEVLNSALTKLQFIATESFVNDIAWGKFIAIRITSVEWLDNPTGEEEDLVNNLINTGNLHVSLIRFLSHDQQQIIRNNDEMPITRTKRQVAQDLVETALDNYHSSKKSYLKDLIAVTKGSNINIELDTKFYDISRQNTLHKLMGEFKNSPNPDAYMLLVDEVANLVDDVRENREVIDAGFIYQQFEDHFAGVLNSHHEKIVIHPGELTNNVDDNR